MTPILEIIFSGFVSKVVNDIVDVSKDKIRKAVKNKNTKYQNIESQIYNVIVDVLNKITYNQYENNQDKIYDAAYALLRSFKGNGKNEARNLTSCLRDLGLSADENECLEFKMLICTELSKVAYMELYHSILLLLLARKNQYDYDVYEQLNKKLDELILILNQNKDRDENNNEKRKVKSRTQEYADKWNENMFLNDFDEWDENAGINVKLRDVYLEKHLPHYVWKGNRNIRTDLKELLKKHIYPNNNKMLIILGQPGIGKSTLITWMAANFSEKIEDILIYRFASDLKNIRWNEDFIDALMAKLKLSYGDLNKKIMILDGFDEIKVEIKRSIILNKLYWKLIKESNLKNFSLIITTRENDIEGLGLIGCGYITLQPWDKIQIESFYMIYQKKTDNLYSNNILESILDKEEIFGIPLILYMILALNIVLEKESSIACVYEQLFALNGGIYDRCIKKNRYDASHRISEIKEQIRQISQEIAIYMFENNSEEAVITYDAYKKICNNISKQKIKDSVEIEHDFLISNYFKLVNHCDSFEEDKLYFVHRSIYEYFVAEYFFLSIQKNINISNEKLAEQFANLLKGNRLSKEICAFLKYKIINSNLNAMSECVNNTFQLMLQDGMTYYTNQHFKNVILCEFNIFFNMLEIIHLWENNVNGR